jgi:carbonic anhydrase/acetyltransferase-like protein (isoleucine patch superfamily)
MSAAREVRFYLRSKSRGLWHYAVGETLQALLGWIPGIVGIGLRALAYKLVLKAEGLPAIEDHVRLVRVEDISLGRSVYLDHGAYLHGGQGGLHIGEGSWVMAGCRLHVFNFRGLDQAGIRIGRRTFLGEETLMRGQGGITVGDNVLFAPRVQVLAVDHVMTDPSKPIMVQGITARGIVIEDGCWLGAGAIVLDGVTIGNGSCIGAGAVVTRSVPPHSLAVGVPARVIRNLLENPLPVPDAPVYFGGMDDLNR